MNKGVIFAIGAFVGAAAGSVATYFVVRDKFEQEAADIIDEYAERCQDRIEKVMNAYDQKMNSSDDEKEEEASDEDVPHIENELDKYEGVKKYHHYSGGFDAMSTTSSKVFDKKKGNDMTEGQKDLEKYPKIDDMPNYIEEIDEDEFLNTHYAPDGKTEFDKVTLDYDYNTDRLLYAANSDSPILAEEKYGCLRSEIIGNIWKFAPDFIDDEENGTGAAYVRNNNINIDFEMIVHYDKSKDVMEV